MSADEKNKGGVHRLLDIVVEEVSLVDRAANKHRFLIVKRSNEMDETTSGTGDAPAQEQHAAGAPEAPEATDPQAPGEAGGEPTMGQGGEALDLALEALEELTGVVERLGTAEGAEARAEFPGLAEELRAAADRLAALAGEPGEEEAEDLQGTPPAAGKDLAEVVAEVRAALQRVGTMIDAGGKPGTAPAPAPAAAPAPAPSAPTPAEGNGGSGQEPIAALTAEVRGLAGTVREQQQRLARLEKRSGLPNSTPPGERTRRPADEENVSWPQDLNRRCDRESVAKDVSFHDA